MTDERIDQGPAAEPGIAERGAASPESIPAESIRVDPAVAAARDICPFLLAADGGWRSVDATGDHRCTAVFPPAQLAAEKQRRLCLTADHETCATFIAALEAREPATIGVEAGTRPMPRTTPVVLERSRLALPALSLRPDRSAGQAALVILLVIAFGGVLVSRLGPDEGGSPGAIGDPSSSPAVSAPATTPAASAGVVAPTEAPTDVAPTPGLTLVPTEVTPAPSGKPSTYTVKSGDTLSGIASVYGTTWKVLAELNDIKDPGVLRVGTVLQLP